MRDIIVEFEKVSKTYGTSGEVHALDAVDLQITKGERVAIMGPSGSGKSTLLNMICGLDMPTSGCVKFEGRDLAEMNHNERTRLRRQKVGMVFQTFNLMPTLNGVENVALPLRLSGVRSGDANARARKMLDKVGLTERADHLPDAMSGGERQRVAIARALIFDPPVLSADEPTGNLDSRTGSEIMQLMDDIHDEFGTTIVLVTHNELAAAHCERRVTLLDGRIVEDVITGTKNGPAI